MISRRFTAFTISVQLLTFRVATLQSQSNSLHFLRLFQVFLTEASIFIKPGTVYIFLCTPGYTICSPSCVCQLNSTREQSGYVLFGDCRNCGSTRKANHNVPGVFQTSVEFLDFSRFSRWVATLITLFN